MRQFFLLGLLTLLFPFALSAQNITVSGKVFDANSNEPLVGVTVVQTGTQNGTITDINGNYSLSCPGDASITFSYIGYVTQTVFVNGKTTLPVYLNTDDKTLDEIVVVGYGTQRKSDLTGSVASVGSEDMQNRSTSDAAQALQGKAAGVQVLTNSGAPGSGAEIRVRGMSSNSGNLGPLLIVDGLKVDNIQYLDPEMIESMEILKDAASAAIYGAQAGNGVVLITTKNGNKAKDGTIFYNGQWSLSSLSGDIDVMGRDQYLRFLQDRGYGDLEAIKSKYGYNGTDEFNWQDEVFEPTWNSRHTIGFQGGNEKGSYFVALNHVKWDGIFTGSKDVYKRFSIQANGDYKIKKWLTVGTTNSIEKWSTKSISQRSDNGSALLGAITSDPLFGPICNDNSELNQAQQEALSKGIEVPANEDGKYYKLSPITGETQSGNPFIRRDTDDNPSHGINLRGSAYLNFNPLEGLVYTSRFGYRIGQRNAREYEHPFVANSFVGKSDYRIRATTDASHYYQWENFINYNKTFAEKHSIGVMVGMSWEQSESDNTWVEAKGSNGQNIFKGETDNYHYMNYVLDDIKKTAGNEPNVSKNMSYFGRLTYAYDNRYSIQFNFRADAFDSSKLPEATRWGKFPSFSAGWTLSNESFIRDNISTEVLSFLKLRGSWGKNGNINVLNGYPYSESIKLNDVWYQYGKTDARVYGSIPNRMPNPDLVWEESVQIDLGLDARFLNSRLTLGIDWYKKTTEGLLVPVKPVVETGIASVTLNAGDVENSGLELELGWKDKIGSDLHYSVNANMATLKNELTYLNPTVDYIAGSPNIQGTSLATRCSRGEPLYYFYGYETAGVDPANGKILYKHADGTTSDTPNPDEKTNIGNGLPTLTYGITLNLDYKGFDLTVFGTGVAGNEIVPAAWRPDRDYCNNYTYFYNNSWFPSNTNAKFPSVAYWTEDAYSTDLNVFNGSYFKIKQIQLGYTLPKAVASKAYLANMRVFASLENFFTFTKYIGLDPETASANSNNQLGFDFGTYPTAKQVIFGVNITF